MLGQGFAVELYILEAIAYFFHFQPPYTSNIHPKRLERKRKKQFFLIFFAENYYTKQGKLLNKKAPAEANRGAGYCQHSYTLSIHALYTPAHKT